MKMLKYLLLFSVLFYFNAYSQMGPPRGRERLEQLEKIKLIEVLKMDEETTLRFFARRTEMKSKIDELNKNADELLKEMETMMKDEDDVDEAALKSKIDEWKKIQSEIERTKSEFIDSLYDILTTEQIAKMIIFEKRFRDELRRVLIKDRHRKMHK